MPPCDCHIEPDSGIKIDAHAVISRAVEEGIEYGWNRAHKHTDDPEPEDVRTHIFEAVMNQISEYVRWGGL